MIVRSPISRFTGLIVIVFSVMTNPKAVARQHATAGTEKIMMLNS